LDSTIKIKLFPIDLPFFSIATYTQGLYFPDHRELIMVRKPCGRKNAKRVYTHWPVFPHDKQVSYAGY
jgi:hypothetical protein